MTDTNPPTKKEIADAMAVLARATGTTRPKTAAEMLRMTDAELDSAGIDSDEMFRIARAGVPESD